ncbi:FUSC family protein [Candidimonas humi]|uniref:Aromatic acid exporter family protein n=1 Tax=Candidimonas humi TaxID=683355 RepID=A0ABV8NXC7_9BURK|nr:FUSC family protein [Candidimonas humi]MBV6306317.1 FUSC family protein [Candidimonas humi]
MNDDDHAAPAAKPAPDQIPRSTSRGLCNLGLTIWDRWRSAWREIAAATVAAMLAWVVAQKLFDHTHPIFAAVIAIVALGPGIPSHRRQAWGLVLGVALGILVGEVARFIPEPAVATGVGVFVSMMIATSFGMGPVVPIQAGVSLLLVLTLGTQTAGYVRMIDVVIGAVIGLICGRLLLRPKP